MIYAFVIRVFFFCRVQITGIKTWLIDTQQHTSWQKHQLASHYINIEQGHKHLLNMTTPSNDNALGKMCFKNWTNKQFTSAGLGMTCKDKANNNCFVPVEMDQACSANSARTGNIKTMHQIWYQSLQGFRKTHKSLASCMVTICLSQNTEKSNKTQVKTLKRNGLASGTSTSKFDTGMSQSTTYAGWTKAPEARFSCRSYWLEAIINYTLNTWNSLKASTSICWHSNLFHCFGVRNVSVKNASLLQHLAHVEHALKLAKAQYFGC